MVVKPLKFGYEGEGPMMGRRTIYASYPEVPVQFVVDEAEARDVDSVYFVVNSNHRELVGSLPLTKWGRIEIVTLDFLVYWYHCFERIPFIFRFVRCDSTTRIQDVPIFSAQVPHTYIKMVCEHRHEFSAYVMKANEIAMLGHTVLLMPDFWTDRPSDLGVVMMAEFDKLHPRVRVMPPVHHVLRMP